MQRRAAAAYVVFFLVIGGLSYGVLATGQTPTVQFDDPAYVLEQNDTFAVGDQQYTVTSLSAEAESAEGGGQVISRSGQLSWTNESARWTATLDNDSTISVDNVTYRVLVENASDPTQFTLREQLNESAILQDDPAADDSTITRDGTRYVVVQEGENATLVPASEYFPAPQERTFREGDSFAYQGNETTVADVSSDAVTLAWTAPRTNTARFSDLNNVTLDGETYLVSFRGNDTAALTQDFKSYRAQLDAIADHERRENGLWGVSILSGLTAILLLGMAYLPSRY